jgi:transposase
MTSKVTTLLRAPGVVDRGRVDDAGTERRDPEVPERAKRWTFTAKYKLEILAEYDAAPGGGEGGVVAPRGFVLQPYRGVAQGA